LDNSIGCVNAKCVGLTSCTTQDFKRQIFHFNPELFWMSFIGLQGRKQVHQAKLKHCTWSYSVTAELAKHAWRCKRSKDESGV